MRLQIDVRAGETLSSPNIDWNVLRIILEEYLAAQGLDGYESMDISVAFVTNTEMQSLNAQYRDIHEPTDVLSFPLWEAEGDFSPPAGWPVLPLGDVVVSGEYVEENARRLGVSFQSELVLVIVHGILHLIGFDHDTEEKERTMWAEQERLRQAYMERPR